MNNVWRFSNSRRFCWVRPATPGMREPERFEVIRAEGVALVPGSWVSQDQLRAELVKYQTTEGWHASALALRWAEVRRLVPDGSVKAARRRLEDKIRKDTDFFLDLLRRVEDREI